MCEVKLNHKFTHHLLVPFFLLSILNVILYCKADCGLLQPVKPDERKRERQLLDVIKPLDGMTFEVKDEGIPQYTYRVSICGHVEGSVANASAVQYLKNGTETKTLGRFNMTDIMGGKDWILLTYYGGDVYHSFCGNISRVTKIMIVCDPDNLKGTFGILEERRHAYTNQSDCFYLFELSSNVSCTVKPPVHKPSKLSSGSVFCILFFTVISVYLICGVLYKRIVIGAKGMEQIPNYTFWRDFGNLQADGCDYFCRWGARQETQAYRGIDDHLKMDEERDDQLLNM